MYDLIYADYKVREIVKTKFPTAKFEDASDGIHQERFSIEMDGDISDEYIEFMISKALALCSLSINLMLSGDEKGRKRIEEIMKRLELNEVT